jgi:hypothetical protein
MNPIPNILYSNPKDFCDEATIWAEKNSHLISQIKQISQKPESNIKYEISTLNDTQALKLVIACLGYTKIEPSALGLPSIRAKLKSNIEECGRLLDIPSSAILPIATIEQELLEVISEK